MSQVKLNIQVAFFIIGAVFELFSIFRSWRLWKKLTELNAFYALVTSALYVLILVGAIVDGIYLQKNVIFNDVVDGTVLGVFLGVAALLLLWQCYTCFVLFKLMQFIKFNYDDDSSDRDSVNSGPGSVGLSIRLTTP